MGENMKQINEYETQANNFLKKTGTEFKAVFLKYAKHFDDDTDLRDIYEITLKRGERVYKFNFGQSIAESGYKWVNSTTRQEMKYTFYKDAMQDIQKYPRIKLDTQKLSRFGNCSTQEDAFKRYSVQTLGSISNLILKCPSVPTAYDVLACLTKYEIGTFKNFCDDFGYNEDSIKAKNVYNAVIDEYNNLKMLYTDKELEDLREIN